MIRPSVDVDSPQVFLQNDPANTGLRATFLGTSTIVLSDGTTSIMTDGFFSRPSFLQLLTSITPDDAEIAFALRHVPRRIDAIFVAHSHHDHAMDSGRVAMQTGAVVHGSKSSLNVARGQGTPEPQLQRLHVGTPVKIGSFRVTTIETPHSPGLLFFGFITEPVKHATLSDYRMADNFSFFIEHELGNVLVVPSANFRAHAFDGMKADTVVLGIGALGKQPDGFAQAYWNEAVINTSAKLVIPVHWDDFTRSLRHPLVPMPYLLDNTAAGMARIRALGQRDGIDIRLLPPLRETHLPARR
ncbi:MAG: MBL fold metallo-hydrolase [Hydrogenophaga sp.]|uniref:MBL fold metallo-hydrolase n=1 Tax=Hydrogenophaga sp. TaxID=1904254 RepID=UPI0025C3C0CE|nr:MBL fold metallo-hydrolase [Hydrogenophaga sp.]MBU7574639.1 MBL fold metallo-hydrolase [Hydrogenophaga sp.]